MARLERGRTEQSIFISGLRGVGKTVLLGQFRRKALERDWVVVELEVSKHDDTEFRRDISSRLRSALLELSPKVRWTDRFHHAAAVLKSFTVSVDAAGTWSAGLDVDAAEGFADHANLALDLTDVFIALGEAAAERCRGVVLLLDEVQFLSKRQLESLIEALHKMTQRKLPITMVGAGLPQIAELAGDAKSYAERLFTFPAINNLSPHRGLESMLTVRVGLPHSGSTDRDDAGSGQDAGSRAFSRHLLLKLTPDAGPETIDECVRTSRARDLRTLLTPPHRREQVGVRVRLSLRRRHRSRRGRLHRRGVDDPGRPVPQHLGRTRLRKLRLHVETAPLSILPARVPNIAGGGKCNPLAHA